MKVKDVLIISILISQIAYSITGKCGLKHVNFKPTVNTAIEKSDNLRFLQDKPWEEIKIVTDYTFLDSQASKVEKDQIDFAKKITEETIKIYSNLLKIQRFTSTLKLTEDCGDLKLASLGKEISTTGIQADLVIIPYFDTVAEANVEAYAAPCSMDPNNRRPIAGIMAFNPKNFNIKMENALHYYTMLVFHEINHVLSMNADLFQHFVDKSYKQLGLEKVVKKVQVNGVQREIIITPKVVETARKHFNCDILEGVELENQGGEGTAGSHWESRVMLGDFMIGESYPENVISEISLALFEDSGWYRPNYYTGGLFRYGKNQGCGFVNEKCVTNGKTKFPSEFCVETGVEMCFASKLAKGNCELNQNKASLPSYYQYFQDPKMGGYINADYCPVAQYSGDTDNNMYFSSNCSVGKATYTNLGESISINSSCFMSSLIPKDIANFSTLKGKNRAICYPITCDKTTKTYTVKILTATITCPKEGGVQTNKDMDGNFYCPDYNKICTKSAPCKDAIECALNKVEYTFPTYDYKSVDADAAAAENPSINSGTTPAPTPTNNTSGSRLGFNFIFILFLFYIFI